MCVCVRGGLLVTHKDKRFRGNAFYTHSHNVKVWAIHKNIAKLIFAATFYDYK